MNKKVLITGGTGLVGSALAKYLAERGYKIYILSRKKRKDTNYHYFEWNIETGYLEKEALDVDIIIHLAGAGIADSRWTKKRKEKILSSRIKSTLLIKKYLQELKGPKPMYIGASAIGIYGNNDGSIAREEEISENNEFLVHVVKEWEKAHNELKDLTSSFCLIRIGIVLSTKGGALKPILLPFKFRLGNYFGKGKQIMSWIHLEDLCKMIDFLVEKKADGIFNAVSPHPVTGKALVKEIAEAKSGPFLIFGIPEFVLKLIFGEMSETILSSTNVSASKILSQGFEFKFPKLKSAISDLLN